MLINPKDIFPFELDDFQQKAIAALNSGKSLVVCAPTGSGKTLIGEYAIYRALSRGKRVFYTTPLKALSNQKFRDFQEQFSKIAIQELKQPTVGLITGDDLENPEASVVVMTTEIFRNMLYETPIGQVGTSLEDLDVVILDECHYISNRGRGTVWEESIIYCPGQIQLVALSATIGNPEELTDWINQVRTNAPNQNEQTNVVNNCELINSDFRPVPLRFYFSNTKGLFPLLNTKQNKLNPKLKSKSHKVTRRRFKKEDCPSIPKIINQLWEKNMLPAIYVIFSRRGCDLAIEKLDALTLVNQQETKEIQLKILEFFLVKDSDLQTKLLAFLADNLGLQKQVLEFLANKPDINSKLLQTLVDNSRIKAKILGFVAEHSEGARLGQLEPLTRGIAAHHAGMLPAWKKLVEGLFELGLVKVVFATATLAAGINMPARTTVISSLSKRTDNGHSMLNPSEFLQIAGRAGRRGLDKVGHVVTLQTLFEGAKDAAYLATAKAEPLKSWFTPSYGMVLNLLQKHDIAEIKDLLELSFAEYLAQLKLAPEQKAIAELTTELTKLDIELASIEVNHFASYQKLRERLREERRLLIILQQQAEVSRKRKITPLIPQIEPGRILFLKGKHLRTASPIQAVLFKKVPGSGQAPELVCFGVDNRWYIVTNADVVDINEESLPNSELDKLSLPESEKLKLGRWRKGGEVTASVSNQILRYGAKVKHSPEVIEQQQRVEVVQMQLNAHPLQEWKNPSNLLKRHKHRLLLREKLHRSQAKYQKHQSNKSYYWEEFLSLIKVLREFRALEGFTPTLLGKTAAIIRGENELWLSLALMSGELEHLEFHHLAAAVSALITETPRPDTFTEYKPSQEVLETLGFKKRNSGQERTSSSLRETKRQLNQLQNRYDIAMPVWLEGKFIGLIEQWALGVEWNELCEHTNLDEGDIVRILRRTIDILWQIPHIPSISPTLKHKAKKAIAQMKRFPL